MLTRKVLLALTLLLLAMPAAAEARTYVTGTSKLIAFQPRSFGAGAPTAGGSMQLTHMKWSAWHRSFATGHGILTYNTCDPFCYSGKMKSVPAKVRLYRPRRRCSVDWGTSYRTVL